jgi:hypothetical protein
MKKIFIIIFGLLVINKRVVAQDYDTCQLIHQFEGEWIYASGNDTIKIYLRAQRDYYSLDNTTRDVLYGWHEYKQGNTIIESVYQNRFMPINIDTMTKRSCSIGLMMGRGTNCNTNDKSASGSICDYHQANETKIVDVHLDVTGNFIIWKQRNSEGYGVFTGAYGMALPKEFILRKQ